MKYQAITAPEWLARNAIYQINPRTFSPEGTIAAVTEKGVIPVLDAGIHLRKSLCCKEIGGCPISLHYGG